MNKKIIAHIGEVTKIAMDTLPIFLLKVENTWIYRKYLSYQTIDFLPIWNYNKISETNDYRYLLKLNNYDNLPKYPSNLIEDLKENYLEIIEQFTDCVKSAELSYSEELSAEIVVLQAEHKLINSWIRLAFFDAENRSAHIKDLKRYGYIIDTKTLNKSLEAAHKKSGLLLNKMGIKTREYLDLKKDSKKNNQTFEQTFTAIQRGLGIKLNSKEISVKEWINIQNDYIDSLPKAKN